MIREVTYRRAQEVWGDFLLTGVELGVNELEGFGTQRWEKGLAARGWGNQMGPLGRVEEVFGRNKRKLDENGAFGGVITDKVGKLG